LNGSVPSATSWALVSPSKSSAPFGFSTRNELPAVGNAFEVPDPFVATTAKVAKAAFAATLTLKTALVPAGLITAGPIKMVGGLVSG
jgi:hypothetical protein